MTMFAQRRMFTIAALAAATALAACGGGNDAGQAGSAGPRTDYERDSDRAIGSADAPLVMVEYASVACGHCATFHEEVFPMIEEEFVETGQVRFVFREMLTGSAPIAMAGFTLARCVPDDEYFEMVDLLFDQQQAIFEAAQQRRALDEFRSVARTAGLSDEEFEACINNDDHRQSVLAANDQAVEDGVSGTPYFVFNGEPLEARRSGSQSVYYWGDEQIQIDGEPVPARVDAETYRQIIEYMLARVGGEGAAGE